LADDEVAVIVPKQRNLDDFHSIFSLLLIVGWVMS
jgi:hypothetical protein